MPIAIGEETSLWRAPSSHGGRFYPVRAPTYTLAGMVRCSSTVPMAGISRTTPGGGRERPQTLGLSRNVSRAHSDNPASVNLRTEASPREYREQQRHHELRRGLPRLRADAGGVEPKGPGLEKRSAKFHNRFRSGWARGYHTCWREECLARRTLQSSQTSERWCCRWLRRHIGRLLAPLGSSWTPRQTRGTFSEVRSRKCRATLRARPRRSRRNSRNASSSGPEPGYFGRLWPPHEQTRTRNRVRGSLLGDRRGPAGSFVRRRRRDISQRARSGKSSPRGASMLRLALHRPSHKLPSKTRLFSAQSGSICGGDAHGPLGSRQLRRDLHT